MGCGCGKQKTGGVVSSPTPVFVVESGESSETVTAYVKSKIHVITSTFNRVFQAGTNIIIPTSYFNELVSLGAPVVST